MSRPPAVDLPEIPLHSPHYVQSVTEMAESREVVAREDIYAANGLKLIARGTRINASQRERLTLHKLRTSLDQVLATEQPVDGARLAADAKEALGEDASLARRVARAGPTAASSGWIDALQLPPPLAFRLTVMRERRADLYRHSLRGALLAHAVALRLHLPTRERDDLVLAALCHDLGEMHTDPVLLAPDHRIAPHERRFVHVHPLTGYVLLREMGGIPAPVQQAVAHHHERLDGSGYPYGLEAARIHPLGKVLAVIEVTEAVLRRADLHRLDVLLRLNHQRFDAAAVAALRELLRADAAEPPSEVGATDLGERLARVGTVLEHWPALRARLDADASSGPTVVLLGERMATLRSQVLQAGIDPGDATSLVALAREETAVLHELLATLDELDWLMADIAHEIERRMAALEDAARATSAELAALLRTG